MRLPIEKAKQHLHTHVFGRLLPGETRDREMLDRWDIVVTFWGGRDPLPSCQTRKRMLQGPLSQRNWPIELIVEVFATRSEAFLPQNSTCLPSAGRPIKGQNNTGQNSSSTIATNHHVGRCWTIAGLANTSHLPRGD